MLYALVSLISLALLVFCLADVITRDEAAIRHLPKLLWVLIILITPLVGSILWLTIGRSAARGGAPQWLVRRQPFTRHEERGHPPAATRRGSSLGAESDEEFQRRCRERAEEQRRIGREILRQQRERGGREQEGS